MTPLAAYLAKQLVCRPKHREHDWQQPEMSAALRISLENIHCFEVTACLNFIKSTMAADIPFAQLSNFIFLPAPKTWLEINHPCNGRQGLLLEEKTDRIKVTIFTHETFAEVGYLKAESAPLYDPEWLTGKPERFEAADDKPIAQPKDPMIGILGFVYCVLALVNSPKIIGRRQHIPNAGLQRRLRNTFGGTGFPLHAWTEILLQVNKPVEIDDGEPHEAHLTGQRALHFVRKHIRIRYGQLEYVSAHWRGDPSIGIKQSRYTVRP